MLADTAFETMGIVDATALAEISAVDVAGVNVILLVPTRTTLGHPLIPSDFMIEVVPCPTLAALVMMLPRRTHIVTL